MSYLALSGYDTLAFRYIDRLLSYRKVLFTSFLSYAFANNTGSLSIIVSGGVRYRLYGGWGFSGVEIARIIGFCMITFWLGVFESVMLLLLALFMPGLETIGALLVFRVIYYLLPLGIAVLLLGAVELRYHLAGINVIASSINKINSTLIPQIMSLSVFVSGALLILSGTMPAVGSRFAWLTELVPLPVVEFSHLLGSVAGMGLLILAAGLCRRLRMAYYFPWHCWLLELSLACSNPWIMKRQSG